ncbi:MAG: cation diffusion facilitator family transporter [Rubrimonas sp.]
MAASPIPNPAERHRLNLSAGFASIAVASILVGVKLWAQLKTGSLSVAASMIDSVLDLMIAAANLAAIRYAARPADDDHSFGHTAAEDIAALAQAAIVTVSALAIAGGAVMRLIEPAPMRAEGAGMVAMVVSLVLTAGLVAWQTRVARRTGSRVVRADMAHYLTDFLPMLGAMAALGASRLYGIDWLDPILALLAAAFILRTGLTLGGGAWDGLMDREAPAATVARIAAIADGCEGLRGWHDLKTRTSGTKLFVQIHAEIDGTLTLAQAHAVAARLRRAILDAAPDLGAAEVEVIVHQDPA